MFKKLVKKFIPFQIRKKLRKLEAKLFGVDNDFKNMNNSDIFDKIYKEGRWGKNIDGDSISGSGSHEVNIIQPYISKVSNFLLDVKPTTIVDLGCGDFNIGKNFVKFSKKYIACDVSNEILNRNKKNFFSFNNVSFNLLDLSKDFLPKGDVCFLRQVLQHLSNIDIKNFVHNLNSIKPYKYLVITEHLPRNENFKANLDKISGSNLRLIYDSGVVLHKEPFNLNYSNIKHLHEVYEDEGRIKTIVYQF
tara:strand:+ start:504 stop:1247 length:744 start_codon:yes stop_codon:yes gene_type:complete